MSFSALLLQLVVLAWISQSIEADFINQTVHHSENFPKETFLPKNWLNKSSSSNVDSSKSDSSKKIGSENVKITNIDFKNEKVLKTKTQNISSLPNTDSLETQVLGENKTEMSHLSSSENKKYSSSEDVKNLETFKIPTSYQTLILDRLQDQLHQLVVGLPLDIAFSTINYICSTIVDLGVVRTKLIPDVSRLKLQLRTQIECRNVSISLTQAENLWTTPGFYQDRPTVLFITGWTSNINDSNSGPVVKAYACRNDTNVLVLDAADLVDTLYTWSALNTEVIGASLARALLRLNRTYVANQFHLVGHSLGAQIAGSAGRNYREMSGGSILKRITGLDPANPCFYDGNDLEGLRSGDARFVDIIHSNPGMLGSPKRAGDADFFVQGRIPFKSGCQGLSSIGCSHQRAVDYYTETVYPSNENDFLGKRCERYSELLLGNDCQDTRTVMGYAAKPTELGLFYVGANGAEPYGQNANPQTYTSSNTKCVACD
ncbi:probable phospholipase A1 magnifin isoform X2 [Drosophila elegans]|uniref:probable phospholipase A1 magnifin isoform X2 n=1 Tax=Drosophila elegans TaxID=30023 RepID=UPI0007E73049|nr:probable phospholipase A1 magnifin isoform X2 [Drosophila elegans]